MKRTLFAALVLSLLAPAVLAQELNVIERRLDNGLTVLIVPRHTAPVVSFHIKFRVGSVDEETGLTGVAHILEHMLFKGTEVLGTKDYAAEKPILDEIERVYLAWRDKKWAFPPSLRNDTERYDELIRLVDAVARGEATAAELKAAAGEEYLPAALELVALRKRFYEIQTKAEEFVVAEEDWTILERNGARGLNASTGTDTTQYFYSLPSNRVELWALIESGRMRHPVLRQFYKEKEAVKEERRLRIDSDPRGQQWAAFMATAFQAHPYGVPTIGWSEDIEEVSRTEVEDFFRRHYAPNRAVACLVGDVDPDEVMEIVDRYFGDIPAQPEPRPVVTRESKQTGERRAVVALASNPQPSLLVGYHRPALGHPDFYVLDVITGLLTIGQTSRLTQSIYWQQQLGQVQAGNQDSRFPGLFLFSGAPHPGRKIEDLEKAIYAELEKLKTTPVGEQELTKIKNQHEAAFIRGLRENAGLANILSSYEVLYGWEYVKTYRERLAAVTPDDIMRVAKKYFVPENRTVVVLQGREEQ